ncbi:MAG: AAA family ATPase [Thiolinea sp.]
MRPLQLTLQAFGLFCRRETIDFTALGEHALFLIHGPTVGKTTLLDAVCFALYGQTTGGEREGRQMRSDHADDELLTEVDFCFALGDTRYRILRQPEQERRNWRGEGTHNRRRVPISGALKRMVMKPRLACKVNDANTEVEARIGLNAAQFRQVIVLPQGRFRQLLLAGSSEREAIFSRLFQTHAYQLIEERPQEQASALSREATQLRQHQEYLLAGLELADQAVHW